MDQEDSGIDSDPKTHCIDVPKPNEPIITFSPDRCRFDPTGYKSRNSSIASDFELNSTLELDYSSEANPSSLSSSLMTDLLTNSVAGHSTSTSATATATSSTLNNNLNSNSSGGCSTAPISGPSGRNIQQIRSSNTSASNSINGNSNPTTSSELQKRLEKQIAQAAAVVPPTSGANPSKEETEFGEWSSSTALSNTTNLKSNLKSNNNNNDDKEEEHTNLSSKTGKGLSEGEVHNEDRPQSTCVKFYHEDEVEIITKCSRRMSGKGFGGLIPPERLAIPNKGHSNSNRKHSKGSDSSMKISVINAPQPTAPLVNSSDISNPTGSTSEIKPLVQWGDSDESEDELSFFPTGSKTRAKLTDNLSIDNMSLSGEEDDLHLSPPTHLKQKCPCDPRVWINEHLPKSQSFSASREKGQCLIA